MENYTKYKLKAVEELDALLSDKDNLFIIACNKCFKEFDTVDEPDCGEFEKLAAERGKKIIAEFKPTFGSVKEYIDFSDSLSVERDTVSYNEDGSISIRYC